MDIQFEPQVKDGYYKNDISKKSYGRDQKTEDIE